MKTAWQSPGACTFAGRLGYACLNTVLRECKPTIFCSRTTRFDRIKREGVEVAKNLGLQNARDILPILKWNDGHGIKFLRISSEMFPFASHEEFGYKLNFAESVLLEAGTYARKHQHRITTHPGQFTQLGSPREEVIRRSILDLEYHTQILDLMGMDKDSVIIIHMGGAFGDKVATLARFAVNFARLSQSAQQRLVIENDEIVWTVEDLLPTCLALKIPLVLDWHHDRLHPSSKHISHYIDQIKETWTRRGIRQKQHHSESRTDGSQPRAHSDRVKFLPPCAPDMDLMIEAKDKEQAVLDVMRRFAMPGLLSDAESEAVTQRVLTEHVARCVQDDSVDGAAFARTTSSSSGKGRTQLKSTTVRYKRRFAQEEIREMKTESAVVVASTSVVVSTEETISSTCVTTDERPKRRAAHSATKATASVASQDLLLEEQEENAVEEPVRAAKRSRGKRK